MNETIFDRISTIVEKFGNGKNTVFASLIGVSEANVRNYKNGVMPKADFLEKIARSFDININFSLQQPLRGGFPPHLPKHRGGKFLYKPLAPSDEGAVE